MPEAAEGNPKRVVLEERYDTTYPVDLSNRTSVQIAQEIKTAGGRIPFSKFMETCLYGQDGYYSSGRVKIGPKEPYVGGNPELDFATSPEYSEAFGATLGRGLMKVWQAMGKPKKFQIVEMGAGEGTMAYSLLKWMEELEPEFYQAIDYTIIELGPGMINKQQGKLETKKVRWINGSAYNLPVSGINGAFISNELPDAFPIERVVKVNGELKQKYVSIEEGKWIEELGELTPEVALFVDRFDIDLLEEEEAAINLQAVRLQENLDKALEKGVIVTIDYGDRSHTVSNEPTIRGTINPIIHEEIYDGDMVYRARISEIENWSVSSLFYFHPGAFDITANVDFQVLEDVAIQDGLKIGFSGRQRELLFKFGLAEILRKSGGRLTEDEVKPLILENRMGNFYGHMLLKGIDESALEWDSY